MYGNKHKSLDWTLIVVISDTLFLYLAVFFFYLICNIFKLSELTAFSSLSTISFSSFLILPIVQIYFLRVTAAYKQEVLLRQQRALPNLSKGIILSAIVFFTGYHLFASDLPRIFLPLVIVESVIAFVFVYGARELSAWFFKNHATNYSIEKILFVGWSKRMERILQAINTEMGRLQEIAGFVGSRDAASAIFAEEKGYTPLGDIKNLDAIVKEHGITIIIVDGSTTAADEESKISRICSKYLINLKTIPSVFDIWSSGLTIQTIAGIPLLAIHELRHERLHNRILKRAVDILGAIVGLILSSPIIAVCGLIIYKESPGPIFYKQVRIGKSGKPFTMFKLRSMRLDAEKGSGPVWTKADDPRRLKIGTFLRAWNIDEIPQFWNVLIGEMSLVGPRPERPEFVEAFNQTVRHYNLRHTCKPGMTGWAAIHGLRGNTSLVDRLEYDLFYVENWSIDMDFYIMLRTLMPPKNAY